MMDGISSWTWSVVEFLANIAVIAFVLARFGFIKIPKAQGDVVGSAGETWSTAENFISNAANIAKKVNQAFDKSDPKTEVKTE